MLEESLLQAQIECCHEDLISKRLANRQSRLSLALEAQSAMEAFGHDSTHSIKQAGREAIRIACLPAETSDSQTSSLEYLRLRGLSEEAISHVGSQFGKIVQEVYTKTHAGCPPEKHFDLIKTDGKRIHRPLNIYNSQLDRAIFDRSYDMLRFYDCYRDWVV